MPTFRVVIETRDGYEKRVDAASAEEAQASIEAEDTWSSPDHGWTHTDDCYCGIASIEQVRD